MPRNVSFFLTRNNIALFISLIVSSVIIIGCRKTNEGLPIEKISGKGNISIDEVVKWNNWYSNTIKDAPKLLFNKAEQKIIQSRYYMRVPLENSSGMIYFTKTTSLQAVFIRTNIKEGKLTQDPNQNMEFIDLNNFNYQVVTYKNKKADLIFHAVTNSPTQNSRSDGLQVKTNGTFWFDLGCILSFGIPRWNDNNERECWGLNLWSWIANLFSPNDGDGGGGNDGTSSYLLPVIGGGGTGADPSSGIYGGGVGGPYVPVFGGNPSALQDAWGTVSNTLTDANGYYYDRLAEISDLTGTDENSILPCSQLQLFKQFSEQFFQNLTIFSAPQSVKDRIQNIINNNNHFTTSNLFIQTLNDAKGAVLNCDFFPINITALPTINSHTQTPEEFLEFFRLHMSDFITPGIYNTVLFTPYIDGGLDETSRWSQFGSSTIGTLIHIPLTTPFDGSVIETDYTINPGPPANSSYTFSTIHTPLDHYHPVSGNRRFGIYRDQAGTLVFYIAGVDRISTNSIAFGNAIASFFGQGGFTQADLLWRDIQKNMITFINNNGGHAATFSGLPDYTARPDWTDVDLYLKKQIDFAELKRRLGC